jgi:cell division protein FtsI (penicillin-binding protein 3)
VINENSPTVVEENICSEKTLGRLKECLVGVCSDSGGTAYNLFKGSLYKVAGKTGTALVANDNRGYAAHIYQSSFAGYFPAEDPKYSCIVVIRNKPFAKKFYGAAVAGPVFKEIADKLYAMNIKNSDQFPAGKNDSSFHFFSGSSADMRLVMNFLLWKYKDSTQKNEWANIYSTGNEVVMKKKNILNQKMPDMTGMGLKDGLHLLENMNLKVIVKGKGKVTMQSIEPGSTMSGRETVIIELN